MKKKEVKKIYINILIDLDGTLTDSWEGITKSMKYALSKVGVQIKDEKELIPLVGPPIKEAFRDAYNLSEKDIDTALGYYRKRYSEKGLYENALHDGSEDLLKMLKEQGRNVYLATSKPRPFAVEILKHYGVDKYFDGIYGATMDESLVKKVDIINEAIKKERLDVEESIMVGDREYDIFGAKAVGMDSVFMTHGYADKAEAEVLKKTATYVVDDMQELSTLFSNR